MNTTEPIGKKEEVKQGFKFTADQKALLKRTMMPDSTPDELEQFVYFCEKLQLDPFLKQIAPNKRNTKCGKKDGKDIWRTVVTPMVTIDGLRLQAMRSHQYDGQTKQEWCGDDGKWVEIWTDTAKHPFAARIGVYRKGFREPIYAVARWHSYASYYTDDKMKKLSPMWEKMQDLMLSKCAEALALRKAFPAETSGLFIQEEMMQADNEPTPKTYPLQPQAESSPTPIPASEKPEIAPTGANLGNSEAILADLEKFLTDNSIEEAFVVKLCKQGGLVPNDECIGELRHFHDNVLVKINGEEFRQRFIKRWKEANAPKTEPTPKQRNEEDVSQERKQRECVAGNKYLSDVEFCTNGWKKVCVHFGKNKGINIIQLRAEHSQSFNWYYSKWRPEPRQGTDGKVYPISDKDLQLDAALALIVKNELE